MPKCLFLPCSENQPTNQFCLQVWGIFSRGIEFYAESLFFLFFILPLNLKAIVPFFCFLLFLLSLIVVPFMLSCFLPPNSRLFSKFFPLSVVLNTLSLGTYRQFPLHLVCLVFNVFLDSAEGCFITSFWKLSNIPLSILHLSHLSPLCFYIWNFNYFRHFYRIPIWILHSLKNTVYILFLILSLKFLVH